MKPPAFRYERPETLDEAIALLAEHGDEARPLAGGQSLVPMLNLRLSSPGIVVDLNGLPDLDRIERRNGVLAVGALTRQRTLELSAEAAAIGALADGLPLVGHVATRNRGTIGGSVAHGDPAAELPVALLALGGAVVVKGVEGTSGRGSQPPGGTASAADPDQREIAADDLFAGFLTTTLRPGELLTEVRFPTPAAGEGSALLEVAQRHGDFPLAAVAVWLRLDDDARITAARIVAGAVADRPLLLPEATDALVAGATAEDAGRFAAAAVDPAGSLHAPPDYQRHLLTVLVGRAVHRAIARASAPLTVSPDDLGRDRAEKPGRSVPRTPGRPGSTRRLNGRAPQCSVNGRAVSLDGVPDRRLLSDFLRHDLGLRGTHVGCEHGVCGACTIRVDGVAVRSCLLLARQAEGTEIATVEGLAAGDEARTLHPLQDAFRRHFALQCGFCTAGILMAATERLDQTAAGALTAPDEDEIRRLLSGHLCRCTGYEPIVAAIAEVANRRNDAARGSRLMTETYDGFHVERDAETGIATITLDVPEKMNRVSMTARDQLAALFGDLGDDDAVRVIVLGGAGERAFTAGGDIPGFMTRTPEELSHLAENIAAAERCPKPVVAKLHGWTFGVGLELALACDLRVAADDTVLGLPEITLGMIPGSGGTQRLVHLVGLSRAKDAILRGRRIPAAEALQWGLLAEVVPPADLDRRTTEIALELAAKAPLALKVAKRVLNLAYDAPLHVGLELEGLAYGLLRSTDDFAEGVAAFAERRPPKYTGS